MSVKLKALVTGGLGFIGSHVVEMLCQEDFEVLVVDDLSTGNELNVIEDANYCLASLNVEKAKEEILTFRPDYFFHLAALPRIQPSFDDPLTYNSVNIDATVKLLETARDVRAKAFVYSSSASVYGNPHEQPITEGMAVSPLNPYAVQKYAGEQLTLILGAKWKVPVSSLRYFNPFGERSFYPSNKDSAYSPVIGIFESNMKSKEKMKITGDGMQRRDFIYVKDVARANLLAATRIEVANQSIFNVCSGTTFSVLEIAEMFGGPYEHVGARNGEATMSWGCNCLIIEKLGWEISLTVDRYIGGITGFTK